MSDEAGQGNSGFQSAERAYGLCQEHKWSSLTGEACPWCLAYQASGKRIGSLLGDQYRVFCEKHDHHAARYTNGRPLTDDRCPWCVVEELQNRKASNLGFMPCDLS